MGTIGVELSTEAVMTFAQAVEDTRARFPYNGHFPLLAGESVNEVVKREGVPNERGIYIIFGFHDYQRPLYIGRAGTVNQNGDWKYQGLASRLTMKQDGRYRREYFRELMKKESITGLTFQWFVTHGQNTKIIPALAEMTLLQAYFDQYQCLPILNRCA